jgi:hypothetical protein
MSVAVPSDADHDELVTVVEQLASEVTQLREENDQLRERVHELERRPQINWDSTAFDDAVVSRPEGCDFPIGASLQRRPREDAVEDLEVVEELTDRVTELENTVESVDSDEESRSADVEPEGQTADPAIPEAETALEETIQLPEVVVDDALSANEQRARSVAKDIGDYAEYNHKYGRYSLTASSLRKILTAQSDSGGAHHQTVKRVRKFLLRLGGEEVTAVEDRGGTKRLVFAESLVDRIEASQNHGGVRHETVGTGVTT